MHAFDVAAQPEFQKLEKPIAGKAAASADLRGERAVAREQVGVQRLVFVEARIADPLHVRFFVREMRRAGFTEFCHERVDRCALLSTCVRVIDLVHDVEQAVVLVVHRLHANIERIVPIHDRHGYLPIIHGSMRAMCWTNVKPTALLRPRTAT